MLHLIWFYSFVHLPGGHVSIILLKKKHKKDLNTKKNNARYEIDKKCVINAISLMKWQWEHSGNQNFFERQIWVNRMWSYLLQVCCHGYWDKSDVRHVG